MDPDHLYHGTGVYALAAILESDELREGAYWQKPNEPHGPRLSRSYSVASGFVIASRFNLMGGVLVLDAAGLRRDYSVVAYQDTTYEGLSWGQDEEEEVPVTPKVWPISRYLLAVVIDPQVIEAARDPAQMEQTVDEGGWPHQWLPPKCGEIPCRDLFQAIRDQGFVERATAALAALAGHPRLNLLLPGPFPGLSHVQTNQSHSGSLSTKA